MATFSNQPSIVILTGAGISAESGINTFRAADGLWENHRVEDVATPEAFERNPDLVQRFYNARRAPLTAKTVHPNPAHEALARLEREFRGSVLVITQNVDDLHERAGSRTLIHMHGELLKMRCQFTERVYPCSADIDTDARCDCCGLTGALRPHIVWFGEMPLQMDDIYSALGQCDVFAAIGTSGHVYPAAGFVEHANRSGAASIEINLEPSLVSNQFDEQLIGPASVVVPGWVDSLLM